MPLVFLAICLLLAVVFGGLGFLLLRWPQAGAKSMQAFRDESRWFMPFVPIRVWTARLLGVELAIAGLASAVGFIYGLTALGGSAGS